MTIGTPVIVSNSRDQVVVERASSRVTVCRRAELSTWVTDGIARLPSRTCATSSMYGLSQSISNHSEALSASTEGANGPEALAELDLHVERVAHLRVARVGQDAAAAERARAELHAALEPADHVALGDELRRRLHAARVASSVLYWRPRRPGTALDLVRPCTRARGTRASSAGPRGCFCERVVEVVGRLPPRRPRRPAAGCTKRFFIGRLADHAAVGHAVEGDAARHAEVRRGPSPCGCSGPSAARPPRRPSARRRAMSNSRSAIQVSGLARRAAEELVEGPFVMREAVVVARSTSCSA